MRDFLEDAAVVVIWGGLLVVVVLMFAVSSGCGADPPTAPTPPPVEAPEPYVTPDVVLNPVTVDPETPVLCATAIDERERDVSATAHHGFTLSATGTCADIVATTSEAWLMVDNGGWRCDYAHPRNCRTVFGVAENRTDDERYATIYIDGARGTKTVRQAAHAPPAPQPPVTTPTPAPPTPGPTPPVTAPTVGSGGEFRLLRRAARRLGHRVGVEGERLADDLPIIRWRDAGSAGARRHQPDAQPRGVPLPARPAYQHARRP